MATPEEETRLTERRRHAAVPFDARALAEEVLRGHIDTRVLIDGATVDRRRPNVPFGALQQIVRNAVIHRQYEATSAPVRVTWFDDRVEVQSPGGPFGTVDASNFRVLE
ncbi:MAG: hypothetical protein ACRDY0_08980 [Acidimicrobiales bacterium]